MIDVRLRLRGGPIQRTCEKGQSLDLAARELDLRQTSWVGDWRGSIAGPTADLQGGSGPSPCYVGL